MNLLTKGALPCQLNFKPLAKRGQSRPWGLEKQNSCGHGIGPRQVEWFTPQCLVGSFWHLVCFFGYIYIYVLKSLWARVQLNPSGERFGGCRLFSEVGPWNKYGSPCQKGFTSIRANIEMNMYSIILLNSTIYFLGLKTIEKSLPKGFCVLVPHGFQQ